MRNLGLLDLKELNIGVGLHSSSLLEAAFYYDYTIKAPLSCLRHFEVCPIG